jgi:hypothetical protein
MFNSLGRLFDPVLGETLRAGLRQRFEGVAANQFVTIDEVRGIVDRRKPGRGRAVYFFCALASFAIFASSAAASLFFG